MDYFIVHVSYLMYFELRKTPVKTIIDGSSRFRGYRRFYMKSWNSVVWEFLLLLFLIQRDSNSINKVLQLIETIYKRHHPDLALIFSGSLKILHEAARLSQDEEPSSRK